jgi:predicted metal-dependent phosphoesterase TrpH
MRIDLHAHSLASDGSDHPAAVVEAALAAGLDVVALTDHDSMAGWPQAAQAARRHGIALVPGVEISCRAGGIGVHMLAYLLDPQSPELVTELDRTRDDRVWRARRMVERIAVDYSLSWDDVSRQVLAGATVGRPHIADALIARGHVASREEAFGRILVTGSPYFIGHYAPEATRVVRMVREAGGVAVMAHPAAGRRGRVVSDGAIAQLAAVGMAGLEADHPDHLSDERAHLRALAAELGLFVTGSSDYHGSAKPNALGENLTDPQVLAAIEGAAAGPIAVVR